MGWNFLRKKNKRINKGFRIYGDVISYMNKEVYRNCFDRFIQNSNEEIFEICDLFIKWKVHETNFKVRHK